MESAGRSLESTGRDQEWVVLISKIASGDQSALTSLYDSTNRMVYGLVLRIVAEPATAEEVALDVYAQVWRQASNYDGKRGTPLAWLLTIARSRAIDRIRSSKQEQQRKEPLDNVANEIAETETPEQISVASEQRRIVKSALATLPLEQREVIELAYYQGLSHSEIALKLGQPLGTVKTRTRLAMIKLREFLKPSVGINA